jgi:hypothetical protein
VIRGWIRLRDVPLRTERDESAKGPPAGDEIDIQCATVCDETGINSE